MTRKRRLHAKVFRRLHQSHTEEMFPRTIHPHAGSERIIRAGDPTSEPQSVHRRALGQRGQKGRQPGLHFLRRLIVLATVENERLTRRRHFLHHHHCRQFLAEIGQLFAFGGHAVISRLGWVGHVRAVIFFQRRPLLGVRGLGIQCRPHRGGNTVALQAYGRWCGAGERQAEPSEVVLVQGRAHKPQHHRGLVRHGHRLTREEECLNRFPSRRPVYRPAFAGLAVVDVLDVPSLLRVIRFNPRKLQRQGLAVGRYDLAFHAGEHKVAVAIPAQTLIR